MNAVVNKNSSDVADCRLYVVLFPCNECAKIIIQSRIREVIYYSDKHSHKPETIASKKMLDMTGIKYRKFSPNWSKIGVNFSFLDSKENHELCDFQNSEVSENTNRKREGYLAWEEYFMALAFLTSKRSKDPFAQLGACIVNSENKIVGIGYNGLPRGCDDSRLPRIKQRNNELGFNNMLVCHAEMNAVLNKNCAKISGCKMYVLMFPCNECAKFIIQEEIKDLIYFSDEKNDTLESIASKILFDMAGIKYRKYEGKLDKIVINFESIDWNNTTQLPSTPIKKVDATQL